MWFSGRYSSTHLLDVPIVAAFLAGSKDSPSGGRRGGYPTLPIISLAERLSTPHGQGNHKTELTHSHSCEMSDSAVLEETSPPLPNGSSF
ncbi:hypothetical protein GDO81_025905 [Engystomops pustulosus]|uniref:Uncharacterized protein n=1 Tax=Engystomops pustulosus TaxID=76066 RepID=A0AAV6YHN3_ENGPU|nr:hypothetical protein GDO81_025905 [Engystomops pustulosus]